MKKLRTVAADVPALIYQPTNRILDPTSPQADSWQSISLPYRLDPQHSIRVRSNLQCTKPHIGKDYSIIPNPCLTDTGVQISVSCDFDNAQRYYFILHNAGTSTVIISPGLTLGKIIEYPNSDNSDCEED